MNDETDAKVAERFNVVEAANPPDLWPRITRDAGLARRDRTVSIAVIAAVAACVVALVAGLVSVVALRSADQDGPPATQLVPSTSTTVPPVGLSSCLQRATCAPAEWDAIDIGDRVIDVVYYVDAECTGALIGTQSNENDTAVEISVFVERAPDIECSGDVLQRSTTVLLEGSVADLAEPVPQRALTGCRNPDSVIASPTSATAGDTTTPDCRVEFVDQFPVYPSARLLQEYEATKAQVGFEGSASEPIKIDTPGTYTLKAYVDDDWDLNACGWGWPAAELDRFASGVSIVQVSDFANGMTFLPMTDEGGTYVEWTMTVTELTYPIDGFFVTIDQCE
ncbi:MAG: hypothetical protein AAFY28_03070 [Actinomycetota bacterium]